MNRSQPPSYSDLASWQLLHAVVYRLADLGEIIIERLEKIDSSSPDPLDTLIEVVVNGLIEVIRACIYSQPDFDTSAVFYLGCLGVGNLDTFNVLIEVIYYCREQNSRIQAVSSLSNILRGDLFANGDYRFEGLLATAS